MKKVSSLIIILALVFLLFWSEFPQLLLTRSLEFGDLQSISGISHFKEVPPRALSRSGYNKEASILCFGDSLLVTNYGYESFGLQLQKKLGVPVSTSISLHDQGLELIQKHIKLHPKVKVILLESIEKYMYGRFPDKTQLSLFQLDSIFTKREPKIHKLLSQSSIFRWVNTTLNDFKFKTFQDFPHDLLYFENDKLYLKQTLSTQFVGSSFSPVHQTLVKKYVDTLADIHKYLDSLGIKLILLIVPNKATIEKPIQNLVDYQHITLIQKHLKRINIESIDIYSAFKGKQNLYFKSDSHWNKNGITIAIDQTLQKLSQFR